MNSIPKASKDCVQCYCKLRDGQLHCDNHPEGKDYTGYDVYVPSEWVNSVVGQKYRCNFLFEGCIFNCIGYDPRAGFWMQQVDNPLHIRNISERAIGRTYHPIY
jgi:hypothetical protein